MAELLHRWPDFIITFFGVMGGAAAGWWISQWEVRQSKKQRDKADLERLRVLYKRVKLELRDNNNTIARLIEILEESGSAREDHWRWVSAVLGRISTRAYDDLLQTGLQCRLPPGVEDALYSSYSMLLGAKHIASEGEAALQFSYGHRGDAHGADIYLDNLRTYSQTVRDHLQWAMERINAESPGANKSHEEG